MDEAEFFASCQPIGECLVWMRGKGCGYGYVLFDGRYGTAHRAAVRIETGQWPIGEVHHLCRNRPCVRFDHLQVVSKKEHTHIHFGSKTHCPQGHEYSGYNLILRGTHRHCRTCMNDRNKAFQKKKRQLRGPIPLATQCPHGHLFDTANTRLYQPKNRKNPVRICRACERGRKR